MFNLTATDVLEAIASVADVIKFTVSGHDKGATPEIISGQGLVSDSNTEIYTAVGATRIYSFTAYNSHSSAVTLTLHTDPLGANGAVWPKFIISLGIGYDLHYDGVNLTVRDASGRILKGYAAHADDHKAGGADDLLSDPGAIGDTPSSGAFTTIVVDDGSTIGSASDPDAIAISAAGEIVMNAQSAFLVRLSAMTDIPVAGTTTLTFNAEVFDIGLNFDTGTYQFTTPVTGKYLITATVKLTNLDIDANYYDLTIVTSNRTYQGSRASKYTTDCDTSYTLAAICDMDANDTVHIIVYQSGGAQQTDVHSDSHFSGMLIG